MTKVYRLFFAVILILLGIYLTAIWYQMSFAHLYGLESHSPDFDKYWMTWLYAELIIEAILAILIWGYLWISRHREPETLTAAEEIQRYIHFALFLAVYAWTLYWGVSYFTEQDAAWHQVVTRDTSFTPNHIMIFYFSFPLFIIAGVASLLYASTRLPLYREQGLSLAHVILVAGPLMALPNVGFNEWGHSFWFMEEYFSAPLHWGFVVIGWSGLGVLGVLVQIIDRVSELSLRSNDEDKLNEVVL